MTLYNPYSHPGDALRRRDEVIDAMVANEVLDGQNAAAKGTPLGVVAGGAVE